jgi:regulation of enolase protein 1 (concanavalin A-like superfamily)
LATAEAFVFLVIKTIFMPVKFFLPASLLVVVACTNSSSNNTITTPTDSGRIIALGFNTQFDTGMNNADKQMMKDKDSITLTSTKETDFFIEPGGAYEKSDAPLLLKKVDNTKPFTLTAELKPDHIVKYDAGMLFIFVDEKHWVKFAFEADERMNTRVVTVRTNETSDDNNHEVVKDSIIFLKISSDAKSVGFYYSTDNKIWNLVRVFKNEFPKNIFAGIGTQSPAGNGNKTIFYGVQFSETPVKDFRSGI